MLHLLSLLVLRMGKYKMEPHALEKVKWFSIDEIPENITMTTDYALKQLKLV
ncbi:hypothetical protein ACPCXF_00670 [Lysinibacillus agricola]